MFALFSYLKSFKYIQADVVQVRYMILNDLMNGMFMYVHWMALCTLNCVIIQGYKMMMCGVLKPILLPLLLLLHPLGTLKSITTV